MQKPNAEQLAQLEQSFNAIRDEAIADLGDRDAKHIYKIIRIQRGCEISGRLLIMFGFNPIPWVLGVCLLGLSKILETMEIGHNVMHGQYDWMNDSNINSRKFEWDIVGDSASWKRVHNFEHHTYTNIIGKDRDFGYGVLRLSDDTRWKPKNRWQCLTFVIFSLVFQWGVSYHELAGERVFGGKPRKNSKLPITHNELKKAFYHKINRQVFKDYIFFPLLCWPMFLPVLAGNALANMIRNIWTSSIIFCGHFTEGIHTFQQSECENETEGQWYYRQILGSSNISGPRWFHILTGHLSCQIEHHLFPDIPSLRYPAMAIEVQEICRKYDIPYNNGSFFKQYGTVLQRVFKYSFPEKTPASNIEKPNCG